MSSRIILVLLSCILAPSLALAQEKPQPPVTLNVGDPAPPLATGDFVKGEPLKELEKGKSYVVEFWATWCGPCVASIPHLSKLAEEYKDISFIGVDCWEDDPAAVKKFVADMGDKMNYRVALDDTSGGDARNGKMSQTWMRAAGERGIPTAFLVNADSKIAWIGHPMSLDPILKSYKAGTLDIEKQKAARAAAQKMDKELSAAMKAKDYKKALEIIDRHTKDDPEAAENYAGFRYNLLVRGKDFPAAVAAARKLAEKNNDSPSMMNQIAWSMVNPDEPFENPDLDLALKCAERARELAPEDANIVDTLAHVHAARGDIDKAIELETLAAAKQEGSKKQQFEKALEGFKAKKGGGK